MGESRKLHPPPPAHRNFLCAHGLSLCRRFHFSAMICLFLQVVGIPVSWKKLQISCRVDWIGWRLCFSSGTVSLRDEKRLRLLELVRSLLRSNGRVSSKDLESFLGLAMWACALFPNMRSMLHPFYKDLWAPAATNFSVAPSSWHSMRERLNLSC